MVSYRSRTAGIDRATKTMETAIMEAVPGGTPEAKAIMLALHATGASTLDILKSLVTLVPIEAIAPLTMGWIRAEARKPAKTGGSPVGVLITLLASVSPKLAAAALAQPKLENLHVKASLRLPDSDWLVGLPTGLQVDGALDLACCVNLAKLPANLKVGGTLRVNNCPSLTHLPEDLVANTVVIRKDRSYDGFLEDRECPNCGSPEEINVLCRGTDEGGHPVKEWSILFDDGLEFDEIDGDSDWAGPCECKACNFVGDVDHFNDFGPAGGLAAPGETPWDKITPVGVKAVSCP